MTETPDLAAQARAISDELDRLPKRIAELSQQRRAVLSEMRKTMSAQQIADAIGKSRARVYELLKP